MRKYKIHIAVSSLMLVLGLGLAFTLTSFSAYKPLEDMRIEPSGMAQKQTKIIPVNSLGEPNPIIYWSQTDNGSFRAGSDRSNYYAVAPNGGTDQNPYPQANSRFNVAMDMEPYLPTKGFEDTRGNIYTNKEVRDNGGYELYIPGIKVIPTAATRESPGFEKKLISGTTSTLDFWIDSGGPRTDRYERYSTRYKTNYPKVNVGYELDMSLEWRGEVRQTAEIRLQGPIKLKVGATATYNPSVKKTGYQAVDWTTIINRVNVTKFSATNPDVLTIDATTGIAKAHKKGKSTITVEWFEPANNGYTLTTSMEVEVGDETTTTIPDPDPGTGSGTPGRGRIIFTPDDSSMIETTYNRGIARRDIPVTATVVDYQPVTTTVNVGGTYPYDSTCWSSSWNATTKQYESYSYSCTKYAYTTVTYTATWSIADLNDIDITGAASGTKTVTLTNEGLDHRLHGEINYDTLDESWNPPSGFSGSKPRAPARPANITGDSGIYKIDKTPPLQMVDPEKMDWTNQPIDIRITHTDNLSGIYDAGYELTNISYYGPAGNKADRARKPSGGQTGDLVWNPTIRIDQQGVYHLKTWLGDVAGWPEQGTTGAQEYWYIDYRYDAIAPYGVQFQPGIGGITKDSKFDYVTDPSNTVQFRVGDDLSGVVKTEFSWSKSPDLGRPHVNSWNGGWYPIPITTPDYATAANQYSGWVDVNINSKTQYNMYQADNYDDEKEGTWFLHIRITDRAGNVTQSVSPPILVNKLKNFRVYKISDFAWKNQFLTAAGVPTSLTIDGIQVGDMPIYYNKAHRNISLGYGTDYKFDLVGFNGPNDRVEIDVKYHGLDENGQLYTDSDVYVETKSGDFIKLKDSEYAAQGDLVTFTSSINSDKKMLYESDVQPNLGVRPMWVEDVDKPQFATMRHRIFLPPTTHFVKRGQSLDLVNKTTHVKYKVLVTFTIKAYREGHTKPLEYTLREDTWANPNTWVTGTYNTYGKNRPTSTDLLGLGTNKGEVVWWDLQKTLKDDLKYFREW